MSIAPFLDSGSSHNQTTTAQVISPQTEWSREDEVSQSVRAVKRTRAGF